MPASISRRRVLVACGAWLLAACSAKSRRPSAAASSPIRVVPTSADLSGDLGPAQHRRNDRGRLGTAVGSAVDVCTGHRAGHPPRHGRRGQAGRRPAVCAPGQRLVGRSLARRRRPIRYDRRHARRRPDAAESPRHPDVRRATAGGRRGSARDVRDRPARFRPRRHLVDGGHAAVRHHCGDRRRRSERIGELPGHPRRPGRPAGDDRDPARRPGRRPLHHHRRRRQEDGGHRRLGQGQCASDAAGSAEHQARQLSPTSSAAPMPRTSWRTSTSARQCPGR